MDDPSQSITLVLLVVGGIGLLGVFHVLGMLVHNETYVHDLRVRVNTLRNEKLRRLVDSGAADIIEVGEVVDEAAEGVPVEPAKAA